MSSLYVIIRLFNYLTMPRISKRRAATPKAVESNFYLDRLEVRLSKTKSLQDSVPGRGLHVIGKTRGRSVFLKGDVIIPKVSGALAMRTKVKRDKYVDWLVHKETFTRLNQDSHVMWSGCEIPLSQRSITGHKKTQVVELGCKPDDCSIFINHSDQPNTSVEASFPLDLLNKKSNVKCLQDDPVDENTVCFQVKAEEKIKVGDELFWKYAPNPDFSGTSYRLSAPEENTELIKDCTAALTGVQPAKLEEVRNEQDFHQQRWSRKYRGHKKARPLSKAEEKFKTKFYKAKGGLLLNKALLSCSSQRKRKTKMPTYMQTYMSIRIKEGGDFKELIKNIFTCIKNNKLACMVISGKEKCTRNQIYQYCYKNGLIIPEEEPYAIPFKWIAEKIRLSTPGREEYHYWQDLLCLRIKAAIIEPGYDQSTLKINLKKRNIPNPLRGNKAVWHTNDFSVLAGAIGQYDCDEKDRQKLIKDYLQEKGYKRTATAKTITNHAKCGDIDAVKAIIIRYLSTAPRITLVLQHFKKNNIQLFINGYYVTATEETLSIFIMSTLSPQERGTLKGYRWRDTTDLLDLIKMNQVNNDILREIYKRIRSGEHDLMDRFLQARFLTKVKVNGKTVFIPSAYIARKLNDAGFRTEDERRYTAADIDKYRRKNIPPPLGVEN